MATKPTTPIVQWATGENYTTGPAVGQPTKVATPAGKLPDGWYPQEQPPAEWWNYLDNNKSLWLSYLETITDEHTASIEDNANDIDELQLAEDIRLQHFQAFLAPGQTVSQGAGFILKPDTSYGVFTPDGANGVSIGAAGTYDVSYRAMLLTAATSLSLMNLGLWQEGVQIADAGARPDDTGNPLKQIYFCAPPKRIIVSAGDNIAVRAGAQQADLETYDSSPGLYTNLLIQRIS